MKLGAIIPIQTEDGWFCIAVLGGPYTTEAQTRAECELQAEQREQEELAGRFPILPKRSDVDRAMDANGDA